jgi:hypothetical protein
MPKDNKTFQKMNSFLLMNKIRLSGLQPTIYFRGEKRCCEELLTVWGTGTI